MSVNSETPEIPEIPEDGPLEDSVATLNSLRPKRRTAAKVDYSEKKEDEDDDSKRKSSSPTPSKGKTDDANASNISAITGKRKYTRKSAISSNTTLSNSRSESPSLQEDEAATSSSFPLNYEPAADKTSTFSNVLDLTGAVLKDTVELKLKNGMTIKKNDNIYLICEPPGEPYYIGRIMAFVKKSSKVDADSTPKEDTLDKPPTRGSKTSIEPADDYMFKINWWYRCRDISKKSTDSRLLYASMHSDTCPLQSFRGKCVVKHREEIDDLESYKNVPNQFWFEKLFDRYMIKFYDVVPTSLLTYLPPNYQKALNKRFQYIFIEQGRSKDMLQSPKSCVKCNQWCTSNDSIECCECHNFYHMLCLDPPLLKKPARGFAWSCIQCTRKLENNTAHVQLTQNLKPELQLNAANEQPQTVLGYEQSAITFLEKDQLTFTQRRNEEEWIYRYLGMHAKLEDALDVQDRPYPRAASRLGNKHQLTGIPDWFDHTVQYYDNSELDEKYQKATSASSGKKRKYDGRKRRNIMNEPIEEEHEIVPLKLPEQYESLKPDDFPPWLQERPKGYVERGGDSTVELMWKQPEDNLEMDSKIDEYVKECAPIAESLNLLPNTPNFCDAILKNLLDSEFDFDKAAQLNKKITRETLREPTFTPDEVKRFEDGIRKNGSELYPTFKQVKSQPFSMIVRFYYLWKKTKNGHLIWDNFEGRKKYHAKKTLKDHEKDDIGNTADDSSYDDEKILTREKICKHCKSETTTRWYRAPGQQHPDDRPSVIFALCSRCARLWRRYAVIWEDPNEVMKKTGQKGGNGWKKKVEYELVVDADLIMKAKEKFVSEGGVISSVPSSSNISDSVNGKRKSAEPPALQVIQPEKKAKRSTTTPDGTPSKSKEKKVAKALEKEREKEEKRERKEREKEEKKERERHEKEHEHERFKNPYYNPVIVSNILQGMYNTDLNQATLERYYHATSPMHNSRIKFREHTHAKVPLISQGSSGQFIYSEIPTCGICSEDSIEDCLHCSGCGLSVHRECYGIEPVLISSILPVRDYRWYCDPCSNSLNPLISINYKCCICQCDYDTHRSPMKRTSGGNWIHIICAIFTEGVYFGNIQTLQPVNVQEAVANILRKKDIELPIKVRCSFCDHKVPMDEIFGPNSTAFAKDYSIGFRVVKEDKPDSPKSIKLGELHGRLEPSLCCPSHSKESVADLFFPLTHYASRVKSTSESSLLTLFLENNKKALPGYNAITGAKRRYHQMEDSFGILTLSPKVNKKPIRNGGSAEEKTCRLCSSTKALKWLFDDDNLNLCYSCHLKKSNDTEMKDDDANDEVLTLENIHDKILGISESELNGGFYGIKDWNDKVVKPSEVDEVYQIGITPPSQQPSDSTSENVPDSTTSKVLKTSSLGPASIGSLIQKYNNHEALSSLSEKSASDSIIAPTVATTTDAASETSASITGRASDQASQSPSSTNKPLITLPGELYMAGCASPILINGDQKKAIKTEDSEVKTISDKTVDDSTKFVSEKFKVDKQKMSIGNILG